jgi:hypothetical protein
MINKYEELHQRFMDSFVQYHNIKTAWTLRRSQEKTIALRKTLSTMRQLMTEMREVAKKLQVAETQRKQEIKKQKGVSK